MTDSNDQAGNYYRGHMVLVNSNDFKCARHVHQEQSFFSLPSCFLQSQELFDSFRQVPSLYPHIRIIGRSFCSSPFQCRRTRKPFSDGCGLHKSTTVPLTGLRCRRTSLRRSLGTSFYKELLSMNVRLRLPLIRRYNSPAAQRPCLHVV